MKANPVAVRIRNPCHPANAGFNRFDEDFNAVFSANVNCSADIIYSQRDARRPGPVPFRMVLVSRAIQTKCQWFGGELTPEIIPLPAAFEAEKLLIERAGPPNVFRVIHHEIHRSNRNRGAPG